METDSGVSALAAESEGSVVISGGDQQLVLSAEDAAQLLAQAGIQLGDNEQIVIGADLSQDQNADEMAVSSQELKAVPESRAQSDSAFMHQNLSSELDGGHGQRESNGDENALDDGTVLYIDPNDPQAKELLQKAGLKFSSDGTVTSLNDVEQADQLLGPLPTDAEESLTLHAAPPEERDVKNVLREQQTPTSSSAPTMNIVESALTSSGLIGDASLDYNRAPENLQISPERTPLVNAGTENDVANATEEDSKQVLHVGADQQQVLYSVTGEDGKTQQYMMFCPKDMDQNTLIRTLVNQISSDPATKGGKKTIRITHQKGAANSLTELPAGSRIVSETPAPPPVTNSNVSSKKSSRRAGRSSFGSKASKSSSARKRSSLPTAPLPITEDLAAHNALSLPSMVTNGNTALNDVTNTVSSSSFASSSEVVESVFPDLPLEPSEEGTRVYVKCNYCTSFRSTLNGETWEAILNHILPVVKEEIQSSFYGDLSKHFTRCLRVEINGRTRVFSTNGSEIPQCDVVLTHSLVCRKTQKEFIVRNPDATFVANLAKHIKITQPGHTGRGNSVLCIFCNSPFTFEDYLRHINPHLDNILSTLKCFSGAYCATEYEQNIRSVRQCQLCSEHEAADLRFLPCTKFSNEYQCTKKLQFGVDCFREHFGDNGFLRVSTSTLAKCSVCRNASQVQCAVFQITTSSASQEKCDVANSNIKSELCVCVNCQKQFINVVMKEQGFEERLKHFQLKNMEQLCSVLRVILNLSKSICEERKTFIYSVHENVRNPNSSVHNVKSAEEVNFSNSEASSLSSRVGLVALTESEIAASMCKVFFICDLSLFTVDLTSLIAMPRDKQKNDMLLAIVLEHIVPHTESLMNLIIGTTGNTLLHLKYEIAAHSSDVGPHRKIVLSLKRKFRSPSGNVEIPIDRDEGKTFDQIRFAMKSDKSKLIANGGKAVIGNSVNQQSNSPGVIASAESPNSLASELTAASVPPITISGGTASPQTSVPPITISGGTASPQMNEINKFIEKNKGKLSILAQTGCNTSLLQCYVECKLCSKFSFPDFRLTSSLLQTSSGSFGPTSIELCENCVDTVLRLCIPTEPETLSQPKDCLALNEPKSVGHRLVLSNSVKKWLSLDGVHLIKKTVEDFEDSKTVNECSNIFKDTLKKYLVAVLRTCQKDADILTGVAGFSITEAFFGVGTHRGQVNTAKERQEVQVAILGRKSAQRRLALLQRQQQQRTKEPPKIVHLGRGIGSDPSSNPVQELLRNLMKRKTPEKQFSKKGDKDLVLPKVEGTPNSILSDGDATEEESISAIQSFLDESAAREKAIKETMANLPPGLKITPTGKGVVNIKAISSSKANGDKQQSNNRTPLEPVAKTPSSSTTNTTHVATELLPAVKAFKENEDPSSTVEASNGIETTEETSQEMRPRKRVLDKEGDQPDLNSVNIVEPQPKSQASQDHKDQADGHISDGHLSLPTPTLVDSERPPLKRRRLRSTEANTTEVTQEKPSALKEKSTTTPTSIPTPSSKRRSVTERNSVSKTVGSGDRSSRGTKKSIAAEESSADEGEDSITTPTRSRRQRRERKIFDL